MKKDFNLGYVFGLLRKTAPFLIFRFLIYMGIAVGIVLLIGLGSGMGYVVGSIADSGGGGAFFGGLMAFGLSVGILLFLRSYLLYMVKAGHIAVLVEVLENRPLPEGKGQIEYAQKMVRERFKESNVLFALDMLIKGILRAFNRTFLRISQMIPIPGVEAAAKFLNTVINNSLGYLDEVILAYLIKNRVENPWAGGQTALILYAQNYQTFLKNAVWLTLFIWALTFAVFLLILAPIAGLVALFPNLAGFATLIFALVLAWGVKESLIEPFAMTALMTVYFKVTEGQTANPEWEEKLSSVSGKFREMGQKAKEWVNQPKSEPTPDAPPPPQIPEGPPPSA